MAAAPDWPVTGDEVVESVAVGDEVGGAGEALFCGPGPGSGAELRGSPPHAATAQRRRLASAATGERRPRDDLHRITRRASP